MKILVTTDFSLNSRASILFAGNIANQIKDIELIFYSAVEMMQPKSWSMSLYNKYASEEKKRLTLDLEKFVLKTLKGNAAVVKKCKFIIDFTNETENAIIQFASKNKCQFICIATNGAGIVRKILGTHTSYLVNHSSVPILAIPSKYKTKRINKITYVSDFENLLPELKKVILFSSIINAKTEALHYARMGINHPDTVKKLNQFNKEALKVVEPIIIDTDIQYSLVERLTKYINKQKPDLIILFTRQHKGFFEQLFLPSKAAELTFSTKVPTLIYPKK